MPRIFFNGADGRLEGHYHQATDPNAPAVLVLHPHPLHGGSMDNKVVFTLYKALVNQGFSVLRFNFRGVGNSEGVFDNGFGELADAATAMDWLEMNNINAKFYWVCGFSFGAWIAMQLLMRRPEISGFITISPPSNKYDFSFLSPCPAPGLVVQGDKDSIVTEESVAELVDKLEGQNNHKIAYEVVHNADHFFRNHLDELNNIINRYIDERLIGGEDDLFMAKPTKKRKVSEPDD